MLYRSVLLVIAVALAGCGVARENKLEGLWDATMKWDQVTVPFPIEFSSDHGALKMSFFNGGERITSTTAARTGDTVTATFADYASKLDARLESGILHGTYGSQRSGIHEFNARPHQIEPPAAGAPDIAGFWNVPAGQHAWRLIVHQSGRSVSAVILRVDGDTGVLTGDFRGNHLLLGHYDSARPLVVEVDPKTDGTLGLIVRGPTSASRPLTAYRTAEARARHLPEPEDATRHTTMKNPNEPFRFSFPDLNGEMVSNTDERFRNKVVIVNITGSWCPNCHDEEPLLVELYHKYRPFGLEIVALDFEEGDELHTLNRAKAFIRHYGVDFPFLLAGDTADLAANLDSFPTSFILGRDGNIREIHAGFAAAVTGEFHEKLKAELTHTIESLLAEK